MQADHLHRREPTCCRWPHIANVCRHRHQGNSRHESDNPASWRHESRSHEVVPMNIEISFKLRVSYKQIRELALLLMLTIQ
jgi:hypothetical protein